MTHASMLNVALLGGLEQAMNAALALDPATMARLARLQGKVVGIDIRGTGLTFHLVPTERGLRLMGAYAGEADTVLRGGPLALARMNSAPAGEGLFSGEVTIEGDVELGQRIQSIFQALDIDWEEHLSRLTGDIIAHQIGNTVRDLFAWNRRSGEKLGQDAAEYLQEESDILPSSAEAEQFMQQVDQLRSDTDRVEARVRRLHQAVQKALELGE